MVKQPYRLTSVAQLIIFNTINCKLEKKSLMTQTLGWLEKAGQESLKKFKVV